MLVLELQPDRKSESAIALRARRAARTSSGEDSKGDSEASRGDITELAQIGET